MFDAETADDLFAAERAPAAVTSVLKRAMDIVVALGMLIFTLPLTVPAAILVALSSKGPILFRQRRTGLNGKTFLILKFRSMRVAEAGSFRQATRDDDRITPIGRFLRRSSIDELPQLINVLKGEMSLIGPRPHAVDHDILCRAQVADYDARYMVRPGLTGLAQVAGLRGESCDSLMNERVRMDVSYIENWSIGLDFKIFIKTALVVLFQKTAY
ncbi:exopolysaccharide biosynthesis polyprenyl glycosylphosphotransferase [Caulobacter segnis]|uniref:exopolysaccharide biosynthesis polyprenyl glycosylphosphotransferase n=1 Tax=Caulobacter segnis TaxID=88688 RepID=UPI00240EAE26|nr:exopolysaccharide biosynthesis polyprenyl glycosylphosphotransferase [Caulobacter segnis]MDG2520434.1 exopolysaccharide biosynthesis polyprenyl glycosylphosphotransferase [Caulobacter segnis]